MTRRRLDQYFSPTWAAQALINRVPIQGLVLEVCAGNGAIAKALTVLAPSVKIITNDIDPTQPTDLHYNAIDLLRRWHALATPFPTPDWIITNPPYSLAIPIVSLAFDLATTGIAMLLRKSYTEPCQNRQDWLYHHRQHFAHQLFLPRISFTNDGKTDNVACDWLVWTKATADNCQVDWILQ